MKNLRYIILSLAAVFGSCADKLEIEPLNTVSTDGAVATSGDVEALLVGAYWALGDGDVLGGNIQRDAELLGDDGEIAWDGTFVAPGQIWDKEMLIDNDQAEETWLDAYRAINITNTVLVNLEKVDESKRDRVEGEAKFIRGLVYFELVRTFGKTWTDGNPNQNLAVPLVLSPDETKNLTRNTVSEVYEQVILDLQDAESKLPTRNNFFATTYAASAILSRVYLMQNDYANALSAANRVINSGIYNLTTSFADAFGRTSTQSTNRNSNGNATPEDVFAIQVTSQAGVNNLQVFFDPTGRGDIPVLDDHLAIYEPGDARGAFFITSGGVRYTRKFSNVYGNVPVVRLAEMYLTRAECNTRLGSTVGDSPVDDINMLRNRANLTNIGSVDLNYILDERRRELAFEGLLIHDIKRTQRFVGTLPYNSPNLVFPIPQRERILNPGLIQNEGYVAN